MATWPMRPKSGLKVRTDMHEYLSQSATNQPANSFAYCIEKLNLKFIHLLFENSHLDSTK